MKKYIIFLVFICGAISSFAQTPAEDTAKTVNLKEVVITSGRQPATLVNSVSAVSVVTPDLLNTIPKGIAAEEALKAVPGVRIDNQHNGERVHISIRGNGILTERGLRGIGVLIDGIPVSDPSGFTPDLYDVDWQSVSKIEVLRGPAATLYGGSSASGLLNIFTNDGGSKPIGGTLSQSVGSNGFLKSFLQLDGGKDAINYRISYTHTDGKGYRDHQAFYGRKLYEKLTFKPSDKLSLTQILTHTVYFHQNPEGLNMGQFGNLNQANPDACPFNEYQKTRRTTAGLNGKYSFNDHHSLDFTAYMRNWDYKETSNRCAEYRDITNPGASLQYNFNFNTGPVKHSLSAGSDLKWQQINMYKLQSASNPQRVESLDETNIENDSLLANQIIAQQSMGFFALYKLDMGKLSFTGNVRQDIMQNTLSNKMLGGDTAETSKDFSNLSIRAGISYQLLDALTFFGNWSQGFLPPSTEELANNPVGYSGFNTHLVAATSDCYELGARGFAGKALYYEVTGFMMNTENDFFRFKQSGRGNQEVFYGNAGNSKRKGVETYFKVNLFEKLSMSLSYTFADFKYTSASVDPIYLDTAYVLTLPPATGQWLPNCPKHQLYAEIEYALTKNIKIMLGTEYQSQWAIYTDAQAYAGLMDPTIFQNWQDGFNLLHGRISYNWELWKLKGECSVFARNFTGTKYMAFTEPDPDGNSYQPGPGREIFGAVTIKF